MANWSDLKAAVASIVKTNGNKEITGQLLQNVLNNIISNVGLNSTFAGIATPETNPGTPDGNVFYLATTAGTYSNFNGIVINSGEAVILEWKGSWVKKDSGFATKEQLSGFATKEQLSELESKTAISPSVYIAFADAKNLCGAECIDTAQYKYILWTDGSIAIDSVSQNYKTLVSYPFAVDWRKGAVCISGHRLERAMGYRFINVAGDICGYGRMTNDSATSAVIDIPKGAAYMQITLMNTQNDYSRLQVEYGNEVTAFERYRGLTTPQINPTSLSIAFLASNTKNICGIDCFDNRKYQYIYPGDGHLETANAAKNGLVTTFPIPVDSSKNYITISGARLARLAIYRFIDKDGNVLIAERLGSDDIPLTSKTINIPFNAMFFQVSNLMADLTDNFQVEYGSEVTAFERYSGVYAKTKGEEEKQEINLKEITIAKGLEKAYYFNGISKLPIGENIIFRNDYAKNYDRFLVFNADSLSAMLGEKQYTLDLYSCKKNKNEQEVYSIPVNVFDASLKSGKSANILCVGDSFTNMGIWNTGLQILAKKDGITLNSIGLMSGDYVDGNYPNVKCTSENQAGGTLYNSFMQDRFANNFGGRSYKVRVSGIQQELNTTYANNTEYQDSNGVVWAVTGKKLENGSGFLRLSAAYSNQRERELPSSGTLTKIKGDGDTSILYDVITEVNRNPFWNPTTREVDFKYYIDTWGFQAPDILLFMFGWNDVYAWGATPSDQFISIDEEVDNIINFIAKFRNDYPNAKTIFSVPTYGKADMGIKYFTTGVKYTRQHTYEKLYEHYKDDSNVSIVPSYMSVDDILAFNMAEDTPIQRFPDNHIIIASDEVHNNIGGMLQISDAVYPYVLKHL